jgi:organic radical activating enzyme
MNPAGAKAANCRPLGAGEFYRERFTMKKARVFEIFQSVQGEGVYVGVQQVFVRFFGCDLRCVWCDTPGSLGETSRRHVEMSAGELCSRVLSLWPGSHSVSVTGGEPLLQADFLAEFLPLLRSFGASVYLETNGVLPAELERVVGDVDIIAMDIKLPSSTGCRPYWDEHRDFLKAGRGKELFAKAVISVRTSAADIDAAAGLLAEQAPEAILVLQPNYFDRHDGVIKLCLDYRRRCSGILQDVRVIPQTHKMMKLR